MPKHAVTDKEIAQCFPVMLELRPHLEQDSFVAQVRSLQAEGFKLAYIENNNAVVAVAGYRIFTNLVMGKSLYIDDLITALSHRSRGYGEKMLAWLRSVARENNCKYLHLDSGPQRHLAHKFYFRQGLIIAGYHFAEEVLPEDG